MRPAISIPVVDASCAYGFESIGGQALHGSKGADFAVVPISGRLCGLELDYSVRGWDRRYHVDVLAALPVGGEPL